MILAQTLPYLREGSVLDPSVSRGPEIAESHMVDAALAADAVSAVHFFLGSAPASVPAPVRALQQQFGGARVQTHPFVEWPSFASAHDYLLMVRPTLMDACARARASGRTPYPIFSLLDRVPGPQWLMRFASLLLFARDGDVITVPTRAACDVVQRLCNAATELLHARVGRALRPALTLTSTPLGIDERCFTPHEQGWCRALLDLPHDASVLLYVGRLSEQLKADLAPLLRIVETLASRHPRLCLLIAGSETPDGYGAWLQHRVAAGAPRADVRFLPNFHGALKPVVYGAADLLIAPGDNVQEAAPMAVLEAAACGVPAVATDWSGHREFVRDGETGLLVTTRWSRVAGDAARGMMPIANGFLEHYLAQRTIVDTAAWRQAIERLLIDRALRQRLGAQARSAAEAYRWSRVIRTFETLWREQMARAHHPAAASAATNTPAWQVHASRAFRHFATSVSGDDDRGDPAGADDAPLRISPAGEAWLRTRPATFPLDGETLTEASRLLANVAAREDDVGAQSTAGEAVRARARAWLLKKGYLESVTPALAGEAMSRSNDPRTDLSLLARQEPVLGR